jgi:hypothetical protein
LLYNLSLEPSFAQFLEEGFRWERKKKWSPLRGFIDDDEEMVPGDDGEMVPGDDGEMVPGNVRHH